MPICPSRHPRALAAVLASLTGSVAIAQDTNLARYRFTTGTTPVGDAVGAFATDGKLGPANHWVPRPGGRPRLNIFFERPTEIGRVHIYSGGDRDGPLSSFTIQYLNANNAVVDVPGASRTNNTTGFVEIVFAAPVTTTQIQLAINDSSATIQEVACFPPGVTPPVGTGINPHLARQHRVPLTTATSTAAGTSRRSVVDGFVNDTHFWRGTGTNQSITLDLSDPAETNPVSIRATTTPIEIGSVHLYSGLTSGEAAISRGRFQRLDSGTGNWVDIPGGSISGNTSRELAVQFTAPIVTSGLRLIVQDTARAVREIVPLPPNDGNPWPIGTGVVIGPRTEAEEFGDEFYNLSLGATGLAITSADQGSAELLPVSAMISQHYQVLLNQGSNTYRIINRGTGLCLEPANGSLADGAAVVEAGYAAFPSQRWRLETVSGGFNLVNASSGHTLTAADAASGSALVQRAAAGPNQVWTLQSRDHAPKKGNGGFPTRSQEFGIHWAYNWGPDDTFPDSVDYWPMQWGSFNWAQRPSLVPGWQRFGEATVLMGFNEPDQPEQSNMLASTAAAMWPRLEAMDLPLLGPAPAGHPATSAWIQDFMARVASDDLRVDYIAMHAYPGPNADDFIGRITSAWNTWQREVVVSEFSVADWNDTNSWTNDRVWTFYAEVLWRMELLPYLLRYAAFVWTDDPTNPISDNRGEFLEADGSLTPEGKLFSAWDGDAVIRTDTPYHIHNEASFRRLGAAAGVQGAGSIQLGTRVNDADAFRWHLVPGSAPGRFRVQSVSDQRILTVVSNALQLQPAATATGVTEFTLTEIEHGWFAIAETGSNRWIRSSGAGGALSLTTAGATSTDVRWRFAPVFQGPPGPPRDGAAVDLGNGQVALSWASHGFRDLIGFTVSRTGPGGSDPVVVATGLTTESFIDQAPAPGTYVYTITAVGDTGTSTPAPLGTVTLQTCPADFNGDFARTTADINAAVLSIEAGMDYDGDGSPGFFDVLAYLRVYDEGCGG